MPETAPSSNALVLPSPSRTVGRGRKVVIVTPAHASYNDVRVFQKEARTLAAHGYLVVLYAQAPGRERPFEEDGVCVKPLPSFASRVRLVAALPGLLGQLLREQADVYHLHNPFSLLLALALKARGCTVVYDVHEDFRKRVLIRSWIPHGLRRPAGWSVALMEGAASRLVDAALASQPDVADRLGPRARLLYNAPLVEGDVIGRAEAFAATLSEAVTHPDGALRLIYLGGIGQARGLFTMVDALERLNQTRPVRLWLMGRADEDDLAAACQRPGWRFVDYLGNLPQPEAFGYVLRADIGLCVLHPVGGHASANPNKLFEYATFETPFVASDFAFWREGFPPNTAGLFVDPGDSAAVARAVHYLADHPDEARALAARGQAFVQEEFNWTLERRKLLALYDELLSG